MMRDVFDARSAQHVDGQEGSVLATPLGNAVPRPESVSSEGCRRTWGDPRETHPFCSADLVGSTRCRMSGFRPRRS